MVKRNVQGVQTGQGKHVSNAVKVQRQIKALQKRIRELEYDVVYIKMKLPQDKPNPIGFKIGLPKNGESDNE